MMMRMDMMYKTLNIRNLDTILKRTGLYKWIPIVREGKEPDFEKVNKGIVGDKEDGK